MNSGHWRSTCPQGQVAIRSVSRQPSTTSAVPIHHRGPQALDLEPLNQQRVTDHGERWAAVPVPSLHHLSPVVVVTHQQPPDSSGYKRKAGWQLGPNEAKHPLSVFWVGGLILTTVDEGFFRPEGRNKQDDNGKCNTFMQRKRHQRKKENGFSLFCSCFEVSSLKHTHTHTYIRALHLSPGLHRIKTSLCILVFCVLGPWELLLWWGQFTISVFRADAKKSKEFLACGMIACAFSSPQGGAVHWWKSSVFVFLGAFRTPGYL